MRKLSFLVGEWSGEARIFRGDAEPTELTQTEEAQYKLDGLILVIEGIGRTTSTARPALQALGIISHDDENGIYRMRAFNDGRFLETEVKLLQDSKSLTWGFTLGEIKTSSLLRINEQGEWIESHEISVGPEPPRKFMELKVRLQN